MLRANRTIPAVKPESLYKALTPGAKPRYETMLKLLHAHGVKLSASLIHS